MKNEMAKVNSSRLKRMKMKMLKYQLNVMYVPGKDLHLADQLSRSYLKDEPANEFLEYEEGVHTIDMSDKYKETFREDVQKDLSLSKLISVCQNGWPKDKKNLQNEVKPYWKFRDNIFYDDGLLFLGERIIVPINLKRAMLEKLHEAHIGITKTKMRARTILYWFGIDADIEDYISKCRICEKYQASNTHEPLMPHEIPDLPFQKIACDIMTVGTTDYLVVTDYFTKWLEIVPLHNKQSSEIIKHLKTIFACHGIPKLLICDNMPFASKECIEFSKAWQFEITTSSPNYPRSNDQAEKAVDIAKRIVKKSLNDQKDVEYSLLEYRNHPVANLSASPSQLLISRTTRTKVPVKESLIKNLKYKLTLGLDCMNADR